MSPIISVIILTFHRPQGALNAVRSVINQINAPNFEIILLDNDKSASGKPSADILANECALKNINFIYDIEPMAGVANARNRAITHAKGRFIAFLDDDEVAFENWLAALLNAYEQTQAEVIFGPIEARLEAGSSEPYEFFKNYFSRILEGETRIITKPYGCGNCLLEKSKTLIGTTPFNPRTNETGGEDDLLWADVEKNGGKFGWAQDAWVYEDVPKTRANWNYLTIRSIAYGHNTTSQWFKGENQNYFLGLLSMAKGVAQILAMIPVLLLLNLIRHPKRTWAYDKLLKGVGKVFWFGPFKQRIYGEAAQKRIKKKPKTT